MHQSVVPAGKGPGVGSERPGGLQGRDVVGGLVGGGLMLDVRRTDLITCCCHAVFLLPGPFTCSVLSAEDTLPFNRWKN